MYTLILAFFMVVLLVSIAIIASFPDPRERYAGYNMLFNISIMLVFVIIAISFIINPYSYN